MYQEVLEINGVERSRDIMSRLETFEAPYLQEKLLTDRKFASEQEYDVAFNEFKKYAALSTENDENLAMTSKKVDSLWHQFILFTPQYQKFCKEELGGFLHHVPNTSFTPTSKRSIENFIKAYQAAFGDLNPIWEIGEDGTCVSGCSECASCGGND